MHPISEDMIEQFVLAPNEMDPSQRADVASHLARCASCGRITDMLEQFYSELDFEKEGFPEALHKMIAEVFSE